MAKSVLDIVIKTIKEGGADKETVKGLVQIKSAIAETAIRGAALVATAYAMKKAFDFAKEGAMLEFTSNKFDRLAESIGTTSDALLGDLKEATGGLYSDMELMASAADLVGLGLANTHDEAVRLARVSAGLNMDMNQLVLTLTNMTTMRFDQLGVRVDGFKEKVKALEDQGYSTDAAFKEAFLQQAEKQLNLVGHAADSTAGAYMRLEAQTKNLMNSTKQAAGEAFEPLVSALADQAEGSLAARDAAAKHAEYIERAKNILRDETGEVNISTMAAARLAGELERVDRANSAMTERWTAMAKAFEEGQPAIENVSGALSESVINYTEIFRLTQSISDAEMDYSKSVAEVTADTSLSVEERKAKMDELAAKNEKTTLKIIADNFLQKLSIDGLKEAEFEKAIRFQESTGLITKTAGDQALAFNQITSAAEDVRLTVEGMQRAIDMLQDKSVTLTITEVINRARAEDASAARWTGMAEAWKAGRNKNGKAEGTKGWETVPPGFPNDTYPLSLTSGEKFAVIPNSGSNPTLTRGDMGGGNVYINLTIASPMTILDEQTAKKTLLPLIVDGVREAKARGLLK